MKLKKTREDLQSRVDFLKKQADVSLETFLCFVSVYLFVDLLNLCCKCTASL